MKDKDANMKLDTQLIEIGKKQIFPSKSCPFCGEGESMKLTLLQNAGCKWVAIKCMACGAMGPITMGLRCPWELWELRNAAPEYTEFDLSELIP